MVTRVMRSHHNLSGWGGRVRPRLEPGRRRSGSFMQKSFSPKDTKVQEGNPCAPIGRTEPFPPLHERDARAYVTFLGLTTEAITEMARTPATAASATGVGISR